MRALRKKISKSLPVLGLAMKKYSLKVRIEKTGSVNKFFFPSGNLKFKTFYPIFLPYLFKFFF